MKNKFLINVFLVILSSFAVSVYFGIYDIRAIFYNRPFLGLLFVITPYLAAYLFLSIISGKFNQILNIVQLIGISLLGSFIFSIYIFSHTVIVGLQNSSKIPASDFYVPTLSLFLTISLTFFAISSISLTGVKLLIQATPGRFR
jgi:hypothetical protein